MDPLPPPLDEIIDLGHPLARLAREIDWGFLVERVGAVCRADPGQPPLPDPVRARPDYWLAVIPPST